LPSRGIGPTGKTRHLYDYPVYYEAAFSFRDIRQEAEVFDECIKQYSRIPVRRVLELGAGTAPHMDEWAIREIEYVGIEATLLKADMRSFSLHRTVDFAYTMIGSLYAQTTEDLNSHFDSVGKALNPGGLYFLDWCVNFQWADPSDADHSWKIERGPMKIEVRFRSELFNRAAQTVQNKLIANIDDAGKLLKLETEDVVRTVFPQEFLLLIERSKKFEFLGWWNHWKLNTPIEKATRISRPIVLIRRINLRGA
jgi:hypothetical protein